MLSSLSLPFFPSFPLPLLFPSLSSFPSRLPLPPQSVTCEVSGDMLSCSVSVENSSSLEMAQVPYSGTLFFPTLPIMFGRTINSRGSYVSISISTHSQEHACCIIWTSGEDSSCCQLAENARARLVLKLGYRGALLILLAYTGETSCIPS